MTNEKVIEILESLKEQHEWDPAVIDEDDVKALNIAIEALKDERPQGKWIIDGHHIRCDRCNEYICNTDREGNKIPDNFCPNCGADMREADNDT